MGLIWSRNVGGGGGGGKGGMTKEYGCAAICGQTGSTLCYFQCNY